MKTATSLTLIAVGAIIAFAITAHVAFLNLQVTGWVILLNRNRRRCHHPQQLAAPHPGGEKAAPAPPRPRSGQRLLPAPRPVPGKQPAAAPDATPAEPETTKEYASA